MERHRHVRARAHSQRLPVLPQLGILHAHIRPATLHERGPQIRHHSGNIIGKRHSDIENKL